MKALTIFPDAGLNRPTVQESSAEGTIFLHSPQSRSKPDTAECYSLNRFILGLGRERPTGAIRQALPPSHRHVQNAPMGDPSFPNPTSLLASQVWTSVMPERAQENTASKTRQEENVIPCPYSQLDVPRNNKQPVRAGIGSLFLFPGWLQCHNVLPLMLNNIETCNIN